MVMTRKLKPVEEKLLEVCEVLQGVKLYEWERIKEEVDLLFKRKINHFRHELQLESLDEVKSQLLGGV